MTPSKTCAYCGSDNPSTGKECARCGAKLPETVGATWKSEPFFYNGYIVYFLRDYARDLKEVQFWLGRDLIQRFVFSHMTWEEFINRIVGGEFNDPMPYLFDMLKLAEGEKEVLEYQAKNNKEPARFEIRYICPERERLSQLSIDEITKIVTARDWQVA